MSEKEMISDLSQPHPNSPTMKLLYGNVAEFLDQQKQIFEALWRISIPADLRIRELDEGLDPQIIEILTDPLETKVKFLSLVTSAKESLLLLLPTAEAFPQGGATRSH